MVDFRRDIPLAITFIIGVIAVLDYYTTIPIFINTFTVIKNWGVVLQAFALGLGAVNLLRVHGRRITEQRDDWYFSAILLAMMFLFIIVGLITGQYEAGATYNWLYNAIYLPLGATMYSSLAFYMASSYNR